MLLNVYVPKLQFVGGAVSFLRQHRGHRSPSSALLEPISRAFVDEPVRPRPGFAVDRLRQGATQRRRSRTSFLAGFEGDEGGLFIGRAQERTTVSRTEKRRNPVRKYQAGVAPPRSADLAAPRVVGVG